MESKMIVTALAALAQESRLAIFRLLVQIGQGGLSAGKISEALNIAPSLLSFHLKELLYAGMLESRQDGRYIIYTANYARMGQLLSYLSENCCQGEPCLPELPILPSKESSCC